MEDPVVPLERNLYGHPLAGLLWERQFEKVLLKHGWEKIPNWECLFVHREKGLFLSVYVDDIKLAGKKHNIDPMWKLLNKQVDLGEPTSFLDHVYLGCTQRQCEISKDIVDNYRTMFESRISAGGLEKLPFPQNLRISSWSYDMAGHAKKCVERYCELANKTTRQLTSAEDLQDPECFRCAKVLFQPSVIGKIARGIHDASLQYFIEGDVATRKELYAIVVLSVGTTMFEGFLGTHDEGVEGVCSVHGETKVAILILYGLEDLPSAFSGFELARRVRCTLP